MAVSAEEARKELARRELARRKAERTQSTPSETSQLDQFGRSIFPGVFEATQGFQSGLRNAASGVNQLMNLGDQGVQQEEAAAIAKRDQRVSDLGTFAEVGSFVGEVAPSALLPGGPTGSLARRLAGGVASDVAASVADPVREDQTRAGNLQNTATFSAGTRSVGGVASGLFQRFSSAKAGDVSSADARELIDTADANGIQLFFDDISDSVLAKKASVAAESFGALGTGRGRAEQNVQAAEAANRWLQRVTGDVDSFDEIVQEGLKKKLNLFKEAASRRYTRVGQAIGDGEVATPNFDRLAQAGINAEAAKKTRANTEVQSFLAKFRDAPRGTFDEMIEFRSDFNKEVSGFILDNPQINHSSITSLRNAQEAINGDMAAHAKNNGAEGAWNAANKFYQSAVGPFKEGKLKNLVNDRSAANFDEQSAWRYLMSQTTNPARAQKMFRSLDSKGRQAVRFGLVKEAVDAATLEGKPFSPARFASFLEKRGPVVDQFFRGSSGKELDGLVKVMRHIERAGQFAENPPTGQRIIPLLLGGGLAVSPEATIAAAGGAFGLQRLFQTQTGRNLLLGANKVTPGSAEFDRLIEKVERVAARGAGQP